MKGHQSFRLLSLTAIMACIVLTVQAETQRQGLWHAVDQRTGTTFFFLVFNDQQSRLYGPNWERVNTTVKVDGDALKFDYPKGLVTHKVEAKFEGGQLKGTFLRPHPQSPWKFEWKGRKVSNQADWDPWAFLEESKGGAINMLAGLVEAGPFENEEQLLKYWDQEVEPRYYPIMTHSVYTGTLGSFTAKNRELVRSQLFKHLQPRWKKLEAYSDSFDKQVAQVSTDLKKLYPWLQWKGHLVASLSLDAYDYRYRSLGVSRGHERPIMSIAADWVADNLSPLQAKYLLAQGALTLAHIPRHGFGPHLRTVIAQRGMASFLAAKLDYSDKPEDYVFQRPAEVEELVQNFADFAAKLKKHFMDRSHISNEFFLSEHRSSSYRFAFGFVRMLSQRFEPQDLVFNFQYDRLREEMVAYTRSLKSLPTVSREQEKKAEGGD